MVLGSVVSDRFKRFFEFLFEATEGWADSLDSAWQRWRVSYPEEPDQKRGSAVAAPDASREGRPPDLADWYDAPSIPLYARPALPALRSSESDEGSIFEPWSGLL